MVDVRVWLLRAPQSSRDWCGKELRYKHDKKGTTRLEKGTTRQMCCLKLIVERATGSGQMLNREIKRTSKESQSHVVFFQLYNVSYPIVHTSIRKCRWQQPVLTWQPSHVQSRSFSSRWSVWSLACAFALSFIKLRCCTTKHAAQACTNQQILALRFWLAWVECATSDIVYRSQLCFVLLALQTMLWCW